MKGQSKVRQDVTCECAEGDRPFVLMNMAMTADGKIATANRRIVHFGSPRDQAHLYELRASADAVMCGARTAEAPGVTLGVGGERYRRQRLRRGLKEGHLRVIVSGSGSVDTSASVFKRSDLPILILTTERAGKRRLERLRKVATAVHVCGRSEVDFVAALRWLRREWGVKRLLVEGGGELNAALWEAGLVDELHLTVCPMIFGGRQAPTIADGAGRPPLGAARLVECVQARKVGGEMFFVWRRPAVKSRGFRPG